MSLSKDEIQKLQRIKQQNQDTDSTPYAKAEKTDREVIESDQPYGLVIPNGKDSVMHIPREDCDEPLCDTENTRRDPWRHVYATKRLDWCSKCQFNYTPDSDRFKHD